ncbi:hypothetical protein ACN28S_67850 [Cystobacter fuscus]
MLRVCRQEQNSLGFRRANKGQLGDTTTDDRISPSNVAGLPPVLDVATGHFHALSPGS